VWECFLELIQGDGIWDSLNKTAIVASSYDIEGFQPKLQVMCDKDVFEFRYQLRGKLLLTKVISTLDYE
jgi:hypothetical protein